MENPSQAISRHLARLLAPIVVPVWPEIYHEAYINALVQQTARVAALDGLSAGEVQRNYLALSLESLGRAGEAGTVWQAIVRSPHVLVLGCVGSGKSALLQALAWRIADSPDQNQIHMVTYKHFGQPTDDLLPVIVDLAKFQRSRPDILAAMAASLKDLDFPSGKAYLRSRLQAGECIVMLDGYDRLTSQDHRRAVAELTSTYPKTLTIITSRPGAQTEELAQYVPYVLRGMTAEQTAEYVRGSLPKDAPIASGILAACERCPSLADMAARPLMASAMCSSQRKAGQSRPRVSELCDACLKALLGEWNHSDIWSGEREQADLRAMLATLSLCCLQQPSLTLDRPTVMSILQKHPNAATSGADLAFQALTLDTGMLCVDPLDANRYTIVSPMLMSYLAAQEIVATGQMEMALSHAADPSWAETIVLAIGIADDAITLVERLASTEMDTLPRIKLLSRCCAELQEPDPVFCDNLEQELFALLQEDNPEPWRTAAVALSAMARMPVGEHLADLAHKGDTAEQRKLGALALGRLSLPEGVPALTMAIADQDRQVAQQAAWSLGRIHTRQAVHALPRALRNPSPAVRQEAARSLALLGTQTSIGQSATENLIAALDPTRADYDNILYAEEALLEIGPSATPALVSALGKSRTRARHKTQVARVLGLMGDTSALPVLLENLYRQDAADMESLVDAIASIGADAVPILIRSLTNSDIRESSRLVSVLARIGEPAVAPLIEAIGGEQPEVRNAAVRALQAIGEPATDALIESLLQNPSPQIRRSVLNVLRTIGDSRVVQALIRSLDDPDEGVQSNALRYLGSLDDMSAVPVLIEYAKTTQNDAQLRMALSSLGELRDERAIPVILDALQRDRARDAAIGALRSMGSLAVPGLVSLLHSRDATASLRATIWSLLDTIGQTRTSATETPEVLAATYAQLADPDLEPFEILALTESLAWWMHGRELHESLATAMTLAEANDIEQISRCENALLWIDGISDWLRPQVRDILQELYNIVQSTEIFYSLSRQESERDALMQSRDALLTAIDRLNDTRLIVQDALLPFEHRIFGDLMAKWHRVIHDAVRRLRGQARLDIVLSTPTIQIRDKQTQGQAVFRIFNSGDSATRNMTLQVRNTGMVNNQVKVLYPDPIPLRPLGIGDQREVDVPLAHGGSLNASLAVEIRYDDDERTGVIEHFSCNIEFTRAGGEYRRIRRSPYVVGMPVKTEKMFFGRHDVFEWVRENICNQTQQQPLLMYGERRMGKTSVLYQLLQNPPTEDHFGILFDLQLYSYINTIPDFMYHLSQAIVQGASTVGIQLEEYDRAAFDPDGYSTFLRFALSLEEAFGEKRLVIMMDEFGILLDKVRSGVFSSDLFDFLRGITQRADCFTFIFTGSYEVRSMQQDFDSILFNMPKVYRISYLTEVEATRLIQEPMKGMLDFHPLVVDRILAITACHPYFVQYMCGELVRIARTERRNYVEINDLELVTRIVVQDATGNIENSIYVNLSQDEKVVLAAAAEVTDEVHMFVLMSAITKVLDSHGLSLPAERVISALHALRERDLITEMRIGQQLRYAFRMGLIRRWLKQQEILLRLMQEREEV